MRATLPRITTAVVLAALAARPVAAQAGRESAAEAKKDDCACGTGAAALAPLPADAPEKERWLRRIHDEAARDTRNVFLSTAARDDWRRRLERPPDDAPLAERFGLRYSLGQASVRPGALEDAIRLLEECLRLVDESPVEAAAFRSEVLFRLAAAHVRRTEKRNCVHRHNAESCIFPLSQRDAHVEREGADAARAALFPKVPLLNRERFEDVTFAAGVGHLRKGNGVADASGESDVDRFAGGGSTTTGSGPVRAHFGLGDAAIVVRPGEKSFTRRDSAAAASGTEGR